MALTNNPFVNDMANPLYDIFEYQFHVDEIGTSVGVWDHLLKMNENFLFYLNVIWIPYRSEWIEQKVFS